MDNNFLNRIRPSVEQRVKALPAVVSPPVNDLDFMDIFKQNEMPAVISEIKFSSPAAGHIYHGSKDHLGIAGEYIAAGANALSVLVEPDYFQGNINYISEIRKQFPHVPVLMKDFIISEKQIAHGLLHGANALLLIVAFLKSAELKELYLFATEHGLSVILEVHDEKELEIALKLSPEIIGINNRDLHSLEINLDTSRTLIRLIPEDCFCICESGIHCSEQIIEMTALGFDGFLVGSSLMSQKNPGKALSTLIEGLNDEG